MNFSKKLFFMAMCIICTLPLFVRGQNKPNWATSTYHEDLDKSYLEVVVESGKDKDDIINKAQNEIKRRRKLKVGAEDAWIKSGYIASYWENTDAGRGLTGYFLYQTPNNPSYQTSDIEMVTSTDQYPFSARVFVPGMMQLYKGQKIKATTIIASEVLCIGGFVFAQTRKNYYTAMIGSTNNASLKQRYAASANTYNYVSYGFLAGAIGVYAWNIIDGLVSRGAPYVSVDGKMLSFVPYATPESTGLALTMSF